jgi:archaellum component FlaF (FlaF/FlaG flagellin family)
MKKVMTLCGSILLLIVIVSLFVCAVSAEPIIIDTEKGVPGFWTEPARDLPANWQYVQDHPDTSADGWFDTYAYPPGQGNGSFWYAISFPDMGECKGIWETSVPYTGKYEVFAWIPDPDPFDPYLDESTPPSDYLPTKRAQYKVFHNAGVATVTIDQNVNMGRLTSLGVFGFDSTARVELSSNGVEFWRSVAFDAVKFVPVVHDMAVTDVSIIPPAMSVGQSTAICVTVTNEGSQQEENVSVKAFVDGAQLGSTKYVSLDPGASDTTTILWVPRAAKNYSVRGEVGVVSGETDTGDNRKEIDVWVPATLAPVTTPLPAPTPTNNVERVKSILPESKWNELFPIANKTYTYNGFIKAVEAFPKLCGETGNSSDDLDETCKKELATIFAHATQETGLHNPALEIPEWKQGLYYVRELGCN